MSLESPSVALGASADPPGRKAGIYSVVVPVALGLMGVAVMIGAVSLGIGSAREPGAGLWPLLIGAVWTVAAAIITWENVRGARLPSPSGSLRPVMGLVLTFVFIVLFSYIGMVPAVLVVTMAWMKLLSDLPWKRILLSSVVMTVVLYVLFAVIVQTAFPASVLPFPIGI